MTGHTLGLITPTTERRYVATCGCGKPFNESRRQTVMDRHEQHVHIEEDLRAPLRDALKGES